MEKQLLYLCDDYRVFSTQLLADFCCHTGKIRECTVDHTLQADCSDSTEHYLKHEPPYIAFRQKNHRQYLCQTARQHHRLVTVRYFVFLLRSCQYHLLVVEKISQQRGIQQHPERCVSIPQRQLHLLEKNREKCHQHNSATCHNQGYTAIEPTLYADYFRNSLSVIVSQRFIK